ncbi:hypothetical protein MKK70_05030 [Methylobacterium sp. E-041]|uniref:hypothetical protein n=1 Tax=Methylobacterium sp. E-041 TaxID=2836573 RepID=UPI001FBB07F8|nr:hypothetical protein [Methylobacterium sp. E-041]MCJ2104751.1 hypothetical protein [Methylobacterium sp. E-041]
MTANQFERHGKVRAKLKQLFVNPERVSVIHYSYESFYNLPGGRWACRKRECAVVHGSLAIPDQLAASA